MNDATRWSISARMGAGFLVVLLMMGALVALIGWKLAENNQASIQMEAAFARSQRLDELERSMLLLAVSTRDALLEHGDSTVKGFAMSEARLEGALRALQQAPSDTATGRQVEVAAAQIAQYIAISRRALAERRGDLRELVAARAAALGSVQQMVREQEGLVPATLVRMEGNRGAAAATLATGAGITCVLFVLIALLTVRSVRKPARELVAVASALSAGDWQPALKLREQAAGGARAKFEMTQIAHAFAAAAGALEKREQRLVAHGEIAKAAGASLDRARVAESALRSVIEHVSAELGVVYWLDPRTQQLVPVAAHAAGASIAPVVIGEGIVGQSARDKQALVVRDIPADTPFAVRLGFDSAPPRVVAAIPILFKGDTAGVILVGCLRELEPGALDFLGAAAAQIAVGLMNARAYEEVRELLSRLRLQGEEIQLQNEKLQAQSEEIQAQNEQLQAQSEAVHAQNEELQAQSEEVQAQNEELQAQSEDLQRQGTQLHEQARALREADERKNEFLGVLAHELRNPLTPIANCVELLRRAAGDTKTFGQAQDIMARQVRHMTRLIDDLLDATRISRGKIPVKLERLNLIELLSECLADQRTSIEQHGLVLALELPEVPIHVEGDHTRLCQVFSNLLLNAVKFCGRGNRITVTVTLDAPVREVAVHVADTGMGIAADFMPRIFEPFTQAESELARTKGGLGLGLALAKALLELHGGRIEASSAGLGLGAEFVVTLPLAQVHEQNDDLSAQAQDASPAAPVVSRRVLVIDDNADGAISIGELLSLEGCEVEIAFTAQSGLEAARRFRPHAILCDIGLPGMDGYEFACEARRQPALESTLLIALTGYSSPDDQRRATQAGFDLHMAKPPDLSVLLTSLRDLRGQDKSKASSLDEGTV